ncbi:unnamed protein product [Amoebophrya sp. A25]|nr:unnamed protein product [Amoebophrya sp. A25]|eukprot:GSA25T00019832001.1
MTSFVCSRLVTCRSIGWAVLVFVLNVDASSAVFAIRVKTTGIPDITHAIEYKGVLWMGGGRVEQQVRETTVGESRAPSPLPVLFDTGSAELLVPSTKCASPGCLAHPRFDERSGTLVAVEKHSHGLGKDVVLGRHEIKQKHQDGFLQEGFSAVSTRSTTASKSSNLQEDQDKRSASFLRRFFPGSSSLPERLVSALQVFNTSQMEDSHVAGKERLNGPWTHRRSSSSEESDTAEVLGISRPTGLIEGDSRQYLNVSDYTKWTSNYSTLTSSKGKDEDRQEEDDKDYSVRVSFASGLVRGRMAQAEICLSSFTSSTSSEGTPRSGSSGEQDGTTTGASETNSPPSSCISDMHFLAAEEEKSVFSADADRWGAVLGLALPPISFGDKENFLLQWWKHVGQANGLQPLFSVYLNPNAIDNTSALRFGHMLPLKEVAEAGPEQTSFELNETHDVDAQNKGEDGDARLTPQEAAHIAQNVESASLHDLSRLAKYQDHEGNRKTSHQGFLQQLHKEELLQMQEASTSELSIAPVWAPVTNPGYWQFKIEDISIGGVRLNLGCNCPGCCQTVVDTGSSVILAPKKVAAMIRENLGYNEDSSSPCGDKKFPSLGFVIKDEEGQGRELRLDESDYLDRASEDGKQYCWLHVMDGPEDTGRGPLMILGLPFIRRYSTVFQFMGDKDKLEDKQKHHARLGFVHSSYVDTGKLDYDADSTVRLTGCRENCAADASR